MEQDRIQFTCSVATWTPELFFENRVDWFNRVKQSRDVFEHLPHDNKQAVVDMVRRSLFLAADEVEEWLPEAFSPATVSDTLVIELRLATSQVEAEIADRKKTTSRQISTIIESLHQDIDEDL